MAKRPSRRGSFQQLLLFAFLLITALLVGVALRSVFQYDALMTQSRVDSVRCRHPAPTPSVDTAPARPRRGISHD